MMSRDGITTGALSANESGWRLITDTPNESVMVEFFFGNLKVVYDQHGNGHAPDDPPWRDMRREMGFWDALDRVWCEQGTGHSIFDAREGFPQHQPTHWRAVPPPP